MSVLLYDNPVSGNCYKVRLLLALLGIEFERRELSVVDLFFEQYKHEPAIAVVRFWTSIADGDPPPGVDIEARRSAGRVALEAMERHLSASAYLVGERFTIADIALYAYTHVAPEGGFDLTPYPGVGAWLHRVADQPGIIPITA
jgi:glutathione S-transferase